MKTNYANDSKLVPNDGMKRLTKESLPSKTTVSDIDLYIHSQNGCVRLVEYKCYKQVPTWQQRFIYRCISNAMYFGLLMKGFKEMITSGSFTFSKVYAPLFISFEKCSPYEGKIYLVETDNSLSEISLDHFKRLLRFESDYCKCWNAC